MVDEMITSFLNKRDLLVHKQRHHVQNTRKYKYNPNKHNEKMHRGVLHVRHMQVHRAYMLMPYSEELASVALLGSDSAA
jgi:hypothetical protein